MCKDGCCYKLKSTEKEFCFAKNGLYKTFNCIGGKWVWSSPEKKFGQINSKWPETHNKHIKITIFAPGIEVFWEAKMAQSTFTPGAKIVG